MRAPYYRYSIGRAMPAACEPSSAICYTCIPPPRPSRHGGRVSRPELSGCHHPNAACDEHGLRTVDDTQHLEDRGDVRFDGLLGQTELRGDLLIGFALADAREDLELP